MTDRPASDSSSSPDYVGLVSFLVRPLLDAPDSLRVDCETSPNKPRVWIRLAFEGSDRGRVFGRSGRNIQAIRTVLQAAAQAAGQTLHLDIYSTNSEGEFVSEESHHPTESKPKLRQDSANEGVRSPVVKAPPKLRKQ